MINYDLQIQQSECGLACIAAILKHKGSSLSLRDLRSKFNISSRGASLSDLKDISAKVGLITRAMKVDFHELKSLKLPAILHWNFNHYVVLEKVKKNKFYIFDPTVGHREVSRSEFLDCFTGVALEVSGNKSFEANIEQKSLKLSSFIRFSSDVKKTFLLAFSFFFLTEIFVLLTPIFLRFTIDQSVNNGSLELVFFVCISFGLFAVINSFTDYLKERALIRLNLLFSWDMTIRLFMHLLRLPMKWFDKRTLADILTRFDSLEPIKSLLSSGTITSLLNGVFLIVLTVLLFWLSYHLAIVVIMGTITYSLIKFLTLRKTLNLAADAFLAGINEKTKKIETVKGIQSIKTSSGESNVESEWFNVYSHVISTNEKDVIFSSKVKVINKMIDNIFFVIVIYFGVSLILSNMISVGTLFAFLAYRGMFAGRFNALIDIYIQIKLISIHTNRIADLVLEEKDEDIHISNIDIKGSIQIKDLAFTYSNFEDTIFQNVTFEVGAGELVSIIGKSGCGKSTFLKVILGLYNSNYGEIIYDNISLKNIGPQLLRKKIGTVLQSDCLFEGSVADNVSFFSEVIDDEKINKCLELACIKEDVYKLPMGLNSEVKKTFSAGQSQRLLLARALYKDPKILILDEATSNLNEEIENKILNNIRDLNITTLMVSHKPQIAKFSDKVYDFENKVWVKHLDDNKND